MADTSTIKNEMHIASCDQLLILKVEADSMVIDVPELLNYFLHHIYKEYNRRRFHNCGGLGMIEPYDGGFMPYSYSPSNITLAVTDGIASSSIGSNTYQWPVEVGGAGAPENSFDVADGLITFTVSAVNYRFPAEVGGAGSATMAVSNGLGLTTISSVNYRWPVTLV